MGFLGPSGHWWPPWEVLMGFLGPPRSWWPPWEVLQSFMGWFGVLVATMGGPQGVPGAIRALVATMEPSQELH